ncbi:hypothetical protein LCGC14_2406290 [marine sediment metagenome]|uniref:Uncharacterized protein n=1 Tax=marine sediment metagenome TaxID=412755 RepID=A0A0F9CFX3_9ZZZZ
MKMWQQGDVIGIAVSAIPDGAKRVAPSSRGLVLAEGEVTGHFHGIAAVPEVDLFEDTDGTLYLSVRKDAATLRHQEHKEIEIPAGQYKIGRVVEIDPFENEIRQVAD